MDLVNRYFGKVIFDYVYTRQGYDVYGARIDIQSSSPIGKFVFACVPTTQHREQRSAVQNLDWRIFQTRTCKVEKYNTLFEQEWTLPRETDRIKLSETSRNDKQVIYKVNKIGYTEIPLKITLKIDPSKKFNPYPPECNLRWAIDTFHCVIEYEGNQPTRFMNYNPSVHRPLSQNIPMQTPQQTTLLSNQHDNGIEMIGDNDSELLEFL